MNDWEKFSETTLPAKNEVCMIDITDASSIHDKRVCKNFEIQNLGEYHDFYLKCDKCDFGINFEF